MAFGAYTGSMTISVSDNPSATAPSSSLPFGSTANSTSIQGKTSYTLGGNAVGAVNEVATNILSISASGSATLNLQALTDQLGTTSVVLVRLKRYFFWLLSTTDDTVAGTACTQVTIGAAVTNPNLLNLGGTTPTLILKGGGSTTTGDKAAYTSSTAAGITVSGTALNVLVTNNDGVNAAAVYYNFAGSTT